MPPIRNHKICDNSADCSGIANCANGVFFWDDKEGTIKLDTTKCVECGECESFCTVNAIRYAKCVDTLATLQKEIDNDPRTITDLLVDRYGSATIVDTYTFELSKEKVENRIKSNRPVIIEFNSNDTIECLLNSIPISFITEQFHKDATYSKFFLDEGDFKTYGVTTTPCLRQRQITRQY